MIGDSNCVIELNFENINCEFKCRLKLLSSPSIDVIKPIVRCSYYILNEAAVDSHKLVSFSPYMTNWINLEIPPKRMDFLVVVALDLVDSSAANSEYWLEGRTVNLNESMHYLSSYYSTCINSKEYRLHCIPWITNKREIWMEGLEKDEFICANFQIAGKLDQQLQGTIRSYKTEYAIDQFQHIDKVDLVSLSTEFKQMDIARIFKIAAIIEKQFSDLLMSNDHDELKEFSALQIHKSSPTIVKPTITEPNKETITENSPQNSTSPSSAAAVVRPLPEKLKFMFKCFTESKFCDIRIHLPDGHEIGAHKCVLFSGSSVWRQLLTEDDQLSIITVADLDRETIETLVTFIYIDSVPKPPKQTDQLLIAAETFGVDGLKCWCEQELMTLITIDTAINLLVLAHRFNAKTLFDEVWNFVRDHTSELKQRDEWQSAFLSYPELALKLFKSLM